MPLLHLSRKLRDKKQMIFHTFNWQAEKVKKNTIVIVQPPNFQSAMYSATFYNFISSESSEFCNRNVRAVYPSVIISTSALNLQIT